MNRRDLLQTGLSVIAACGLEGECKTLNANDPQAVVLTFPQALSEEQRSRIREEWKKAHTGSVLADLPVVVLGGGADIKIVDRKGVADEPT